MNAVSQEVILSALKAVADPASGADIVAAGIVSGIQISPDGNVVFMIQVDPKRGPEMEPLRQQAERAAANIPGVKKVTAILTAERAPQAKKGPGERLALPRIKNIIAVASGKGGVGKSTVAANLAVAMAKQGLKTGLLDADIYGPSMPKMMGLEGRKPGGESGQIQPLVAHGVKVMSIGFMIDAAAPLIWRGPMVQSAIVQLLRDVEWGDLDILVVDMPPGTGDAQLSMAQKAPLSGAVIVSTPQDIALIDARKGLEMFRKVNVPVLGIVENMSYYLCPSCGHEDHIFGHGGAREEAEKLDAPFLGEIPLHADIRVQGDRGVPIAASHPESAYARAFFEMAERIFTSISNLNPSPSHAAYEPLPLPLGEGSEAKPSRVRG